MPLALSDDSDSEASTSASVPARNTRSRTRSASASNATEGSQADQSGSHGLSDSPGEESDSDESRNLGSWTANDGRRWQMENGSSDGPGSYELEDIIRFRRHPRRNFVQYRASWRGYAIYGNTWEAEKNFTKAQLEAFWERERGGRPPDMPWLYEYDSDGDPIDAAEISPHSSDTDCEQWCKDPERRKAARARQRMYIRQDKTALRDVRRQRYEAAERRRAEEEERLRLKRAAKAKKAANASSSSDSAPKRMSGSSKDDGARISKKARLETTTTRPTVSTAGPSKATKAIKTVSRPPASTSKAVRSNPGPSSAATMTAKDRIAAIAAAARRNQDAKAGASTGGTSFPIGKDASAEARAKQQKDKQEEEEAARLARRQKAMMAAKYITAPHKKGDNPLTDPKQLGKPVKPKPKAIFNPLSHIAPVGASKPANGAAAPIIGAKETAKKPPPVSISTANLPPASFAPAPSPVSAASSAAPASSTPVDSAIKSPLHTVMTRAPPQQAIRSSIDPRRRQPAPPQAAVSVAASAAATKVPNLVPPPRDSVVDAESTNASVPAAAAAASFAAPAPTNSAHDVARPPPPTAHISSKAGTPASVTPSETSTFAPTPELDDAAREEGITWANKWGFADDATRRREISRAYNVVLYDGDEPAIYTILNSVIRVLGGGFKLKLEQRFWEKPRAYLLLWIPSASWPLPAAVARAKLEPNVSFLAYEGDGAPRPVFSDAKAGFVGLTVSALVQRLLGNDVSEGSDAAVPEGAELVLHPWHRKLLKDAFDGIHGRQLVQQTTACSSADAAERAVDLVGDLEGRIEGLLARELEHDEAELGWEDAPDIDALGVEAAVREVDEAMAKTMRQLQARHSRARHHILQVGPGTGLNLEKLGVSWRWVA